MISILNTAVGMGASDIHIVVGKAPMMRLNGSITQVPGYPALGADEAKALIYSVLFEEQRQRFEEAWEMDCSFAIDKLGRFRINVFMQANGVEAVLRVIPSRIPTPEDIELSPPMVALADLPRGLILVTGPTGSGKSTTLATLLEVMNQKESLNILTIEDPIEFVYTNKRSIFRQREVGHQTKSYAAALRSALRQDPDVILIGEMRDMETIQLALTAAETGHLCLATLHTQDAPSTVDRIVDVFPPHQQTQVRTQLSSSLQAVLSQVLLPRRDGKGRVVAREFMSVTPAIANLIRESKTHMIYNAIDTGGKFGMISMDKALANLVRRGLVNYDDAAHKAHSPETFNQLCGGAGVVSGTTFRED
jgi:twitching motility protein PilT